MKSFKQTMGIVEWTMLIVISICWGSSFFFNRIAVVEIPVLTIVLGRVGIGAVLIYAVARARDMALPRDSETWGQLTLLSILQYTAPLILIVWSQRHIPSGLASILNAMTPIWASIAAHLMTQDERLTAPRIIGVLFGVLGVVVMIGPQAFAGPHHNLLAELASVAAAACFGVAAVYSRRFHKKKIPTPVVATGSMMIGTLTLLPLVLFIDQPWNLPQNPSLQAWGAVLALGVLAGALAFILFLSLIARAGAMNASLVTILNPVTAILLGTLLLGEVLELRHYLGILLIALGFAILDGRLIKWVRARFSPA
jgi:drug/metabolite transporter (DMT)-like permease